MKNRILMLLCAGVMAGPGCGRQEPPAAPATQVVATPAQSETKEAILPPDIPLPPGAVPQIAGDEVAGNATWQSPRSLAGLVEFFSSELPSGGWVLDSVLRGDAEPQLNFRQGSRILRIQLGPGEGPGLARVHLEWEDTAGGTSRGESFEPEPEEGPADPEGQVPQW
jgi:hypothetical protein